MSKASLSSCLNLKIAAQNRAHPSSLLPILYQTRTLLSEPKIARRFYTVNGHIKNHVRCRRNFCSTPPVQGYGDKVRRHNSDPVVFIDPYLKQRANALSQIKPRTKKQTSRPSTVTATEQAVFDRLIKDVSEPTSPELEGEDILDLDEPISGYDPNVDLDSIFEDAIRQLRLNEEQAAKAAARNLLFGPVSRERAIDIPVPDGEQTLSGRLFKRPLKLPDGTTLGSEVEDDEERTRLEVACDDHRILVMAMLDNADSDMEIWQILEKEVFSLITQLDDHIKVLERANKLQTAKARKAKAKGKDVAGVKLQKGDLNSKKTSRVKLTQTKAIPVNNLLSILHRNYAEYCLQALRLLRRKHPTSPYAPYVLATIKRRGPISYVLGVSTDIYNEILFLQWTQYSDLQGMADTIEELLNHGIDGTEVPLALLKGIGKQRRMGRRAFFGPVVKKWWDMRGTLEGWRRVLNVYERIVGELAEAATTRADDAESEDGELEADGESL